MLTGSRMLQNPTLESDTSSSRTTDAQHGGTQARRLNLRYEFDRIHHAGFKAQTDCATCLHLIPLVLCICSRCGCQGNEESNPEWLWSLSAASAPAQFPCSSEAFGLSLATHLQAQRGVKISRSWGFLKVIFATFVPRMWLTEDIQEGITLNGAESAATQSVCVKMPQGRAESHWRLQ